MPNWKKVIVSGSDAELNSLNVTSELTASGLNYPIADGTANQSIITDGSGNLTFGNPGFADDAEKITFAVQNNFTSTLQKGTPIHVTSTTNGTSLVVPASASDASTMPSHGILNGQLAVGADGEATIIGQITGVDTSAFSSGDTVYVAPNGGYTNIKPTGADNLIQNLGIVKKVDASNGTGEIFGSGRTNDVPNLPTGKIWVGDSYTVTSSIVTLDETNSIAQITGSLTVQGSITGSTLQLTNLPSQASEATSLMIGASGNVGTRELGSNAFNSTAFTTCTGTVTSVGGTGNVSGITLSGTVTTSGNLTLGGTFSTTTSSITDFNTGVGTIVDGCGFTDCTGTVTSVTVGAGSGLTGGGTITTSGTATVNVGAGTGITVNANDVAIDYLGTNNFIDSATNLEGTPIATGDTIVYHDATDNNVKKGFISDLPFTSCVGDITGVTAGNGLTGGATSGNATLNVGAGTGIDVAADSISVDVSDFMSNGANNRIVTATGTDAMTAETNLTYDGTLLTVSASIMGGCDNTNTSNGGLIGGGCQHNLSAFGGVIAGGYNNTVSCIGGVLAAADSTVSGKYSSISSGYTNCISSVCSFIGSGYSNLVQGNYGAIAGGYDNTICAAEAYAVIGGGRQNIVDGDYSTVVGGYLNKVTNIYSFIGGGLQNTGSGEYSVIVGGIENCTNSTYGCQSFIGGGWNNTVSGYYSSIVGGYNNCIDADYLAGSFIGGGTQNKSLSGYRNFIGGGYNNTVSQAYDGHLVIGGGCSNCVTGDVGAILGGQSNKVLGDYGIIGGGCSNNICSGETFAVIGGGRQNRVDGDYSLIVGGSGSFAGANYSAVVGGYLNCVVSNCSFVGGGYNNRVCSVSPNSAIVGGCNNSISGYSSPNHNIIGGGRNNTISSGYGGCNFIGGGCSNSISGYAGHNAVIVGGKNNSVSGYCSGILGGENNSIGQDYSCSFIIGANLNATATCYTFMNNACVAGTTRTTTLVETSARRYKECILPLEDQIKNIKKLEPVEFQWKKDKTKDIGFIAEDVKEIFPNLVAYEEDGEISGVQYSKLTTVLVKALQQQQEQIDKLKKEIFIIKNNLDG